MSESCWHYDYTLELVADETPSALAMESSERRRGHLASRLAAKRSVARLCSIAPHDVEIRDRVRGVRAADGRGELECSVSLSHCRGRGAAAATFDGAIGCDLEYREALLSGHRSYFASSTEYDASGCDLTTLWALKEAAWKALAVDAATPFRALELHFLDRSLEAVSLRNSAFPARAEVVAPWPGFVVAVVRVLRAT
jgi:phosphopantetheinyl transferase